MKKQKNQKLKAKLKATEKKYKVEIIELKDELEDKDEEIENLNRKLKKQIKNSRKENSDNEASMDGVGVELQKTKEELEFLKGKIQIKALEEKIKELEGCIESKIEEITSNEIKLKEMKYKCKNFETRVQKSEEDINQLQKNKMELSQTINDKNKEIEGQIEELKKKDLALQTMIEKIDNKENKITELNKLMEQQTTDLDLCRNASQLEKNENENLKTVSNLEQKVKKMEEEINLIKVWKFKTPSNQEKDDKLGQSETYKTDWYPDWWNNHFIGIQPNIEEINENIGENDLARSNSDRSFIEETEKSNKSILDKINKLTGKEFDSLDACISFITKLSNNSGRRSNVQEENFVRPASGDKVRQLEVENDQLHDKIYDLESKCKSIEKKCSKQLKSKNDEIEELQEELESEKAKKPRDNKEKQQAIEIMKGKIEKGLLTIDELKATIAQNVGDLDECRSALKTEKEKYGNLNGIAMDRQRKIEGYETKIKSLEIHSMKVARFQNSDKSWYPSWWNNHINY